MHDGAAKIEPEVEFKVMMNQFSTALEKFIAASEKIARFSDTFSDYCLMHNYKHGTSYLSE